MRMEEYMEKLISQIRCKKARPYIEREIKDHIEEQIAYLKCIWNYGTVFYFSGNEFAATGAGNLWTGFGRFCYVYYFGFNHHVFIGTCFLTLK